MLPGVSMKKASWILLTVFGVAITLISLVSAVHAYRTRDDYRIGDSRVSRIAGGSAALATALRGIRGTSAAYGAAYGVLFLAIVLGPYSLLNAVVGLPAKVDGGGVARQEEPSGLIAAWRTSNRATVFLVEHLPLAVWSSQVPGIPRLTVGMIAAHIHNSRCTWIKSLGARHGVKVPRLVDLRRVRPKQLVKALSRSSDGMVELIRLGLAHGGRVPRATWQNFPTDLDHFLGYFAAHEGHHRGQLCMVARQLGQRLPRSVTGGIWQWTRLSRERA